eukprot:366027-Chlamydomonas_euryale.AAC.9
MNARGCVLHQSCNKAAGSSEPRLLPVVQTRVLTATACLHCELRSVWLFCDVSEPYLLPVVQTRPPAPAARCHWNADGRSMAIVASQEASGTMATVAAWQLRHARKPGSTPLPSTHGASAC